MSDELKTCWQSKSTRTEKPWGYEIVWASLVGVAGKIIFINSGHSTSLKYYPQKDEVLLVRRGRVRILWGDEYATKKQYPSEFNSVNLKEGDSFCIQSSCPYRITALEDSEVFEIAGSSNAHCVMLFDDYGRDSKNNEEI
jgi:mannose-6-phosphate isomerase-like protein (cupin superfamily)